MQIFEDWSSLEKQVVEYAKVSLSASQLAEQRKMTSTLGAMRTQLGAIRGDVSGMRQDIGAIRDDVSGMRQDIGAIRGDISGMREDIAGVRQDVQAQLDIQQAVLNRQVVQDKLEEFIYQMQKMLGDFRQARSDYHPLYQFLFLNKLFETVDREGIATPMIRGRDNKAAFDKCIDDGRDLQSSLRKNPDVRAFLQAEKQRGQLERKVQELTDSLKKADKYSVLAARPELTALIGGGPTLFVILVSLVNHSSGLFCCLFCIVAPMSWGLLEIWASFEIPGQQALLDRTDNARIIQKIRELENRLRGGNAEMLSAGPDEETPSARSNDLDALPMTEPSSAQSASPVIRISCSTCGKRLRVQARMAGKQVKCPKCDESMVVPDVPPDRPTQQDSTKPFDFG